MSREVKLPSGAILKVNPARFAESKALYQVVLEEGKGILINSKTEMASVYKDLFCIGFASQKIEACLWECFKHCSYNNGRTGDLKIDKDTFEPVEARDDYMTTCMEVAKENIHPFVKSLYVEYGHVLRTILSDLT
jgi:hypothetical protein